MANQDFLTNEKDFEIPEGWTEVAPSPQPAGAPVPSVPVDRFASGAVSSMTLGLNTDIAASKIGGDVPSFRIQPPQPSSIAAANSASVSIIKQTQVVEGPGILLETNGIKNPSQNTLNINAGANVTVSSDNVGNVTIAATTSGGIPAGSNIGTFPSSREFTGNGSLTAGNTINWWVPAESVVNQGSKFKVTLAPQGFGHAAASLDIQNIVMKRTLRGSLSVVDTTPITFGGLSTLTITGETTSDAITLTIDALHDYYLMIFISGAATNVHTGFANFSSVPIATPQQLSDTSGSDGTGATTIPTLTLDNTFFRLWTRFLTA